MNTQPTHIDNLNKVMDETYFVYRGCILRKLIGGYEIFSKKYRNFNEIDDVIDNSLNNIKNSLKSESK